MTTRGQDRPRPPSVEHVLKAIRDRPNGTADHGRLVAAVREALADERSRLRAGDPSTTIDRLADDALGRASARAATLPTRVINATGVIVHTNLGRAAWPRAAIEAAAEASGSIFLELDQATGRRGRRYRAAEDALIELTGAEDALVTNNNAAALALAVGLAGRGGRVVVSRGELVEIGGGVRIPEIIRRAGARLVEVGTTNRTRASDFEAPLADGARMILRVHPSNFRQSGFTEAPDAAALAALTQRHGAMLVDDIGSGALLDTSAFGLAHEPMPAERIAAGADLVTFSGDKLLGGPQAGLVVGRADLIARLRRDPLARAVRPDKVTLAALAATLGLYRSGRALAEIPVWRMISTPLEGLQSRAAAVVAAVGDPRATPTDLESTVGGGALPGETLVSAGVALAGRGANRLLAALRTGDPPVVARIADGRVLLDVRTIDPEDDAAVAAAVRGALATG